MDMMDVQMERIVYKNLLCFFVDVETLPCAFHSRLSTKSVPTFLQVLRIRICFLRIQILEFFPIRIQAKKIKGNYKILEEIFVFNCRYFIFVFNQSSR